MKERTDQLLSDVQAFVEDIQDGMLPTTIEQGAEALFRIQEMRRMLAIAGDEMTSFLADTLPGGEYRIEGVPGLAAVERKHGVKRTEWDNESVFSDLRKAAADNRLADESTGEIESEAEAILRIVKEAARPSWRVTALKSYGLQIDEYCKVEVGAPSIKIVTA